MIADSIDNDTEPETRNATPASDSAAAAGTGPGTPGTENQGLRPFKFKLSAQAWPAADSESARRVGATVTAPDGPEASAGESLPGRGRVNGGDIMWALPGRHSPFMSFACLCQPISLLALSGDPSMAKIVNLK